MPEIDIEADVGLSIGEKAVKEASKRKNGYRDEENGFPFSNSGSTDGSGNLALRITMVPMGMRYELGALIIWIDGYTPAVPYINSAQWWSLSQGNPESYAQMADFGNNQLPNYADWSGHNVPVIRGIDDDLWLFLHSSKANTNVTVIARGKMLKD